MQQLNETNLLECLLGINETTDKANREAITDGERLYLTGKRDAINEILKSFFPPETK